MQTQTTVELLDAAKLKLGGVSDYRMAKLLGVGEPTISDYRNRGRTLSNATAIKLAALIEIDPAIVVAAVNAERSKCPEERQVWESIAKRIAATTAALALAIGLLGHSHDAAAGQATPVKQCILCKMRALLLRLLKACEAAAPEDGSNEFEDSLWTTEQPTPQTSLLCIDRRTSPAAVPLPHERRGAGERRAVAHAMH